MIVDYFVLDNNNEEAVQIEKLSFSWCGASC